MRQRVGVYPLLATAWLAAGSPAMAGQAAEPRAAAIAVEEERAPVPARVIDGPPAPVPPAVMTRDADGRATIRAVRLTEPLRLDGLLDEDIYRTVAPVTGFYQTLPDGGQPASQETEVWVMFDDRNLYVTARCWDEGGPSALIAHELRRDRVREDDNFGVLFDTYHDKRNGYYFTINPIGGFRDGYYASTGGAGGENFNPIWDVRTTTFERGWILEMRMPFKSIRYAPGSEQIWGIQFRRVVRRRTESAFLT
jgi:hypothetical protein